MKTHEAELGLIKDLLRKNPKGIKITQVARELAMNRNAAAKYLEILLMTGQAEIIEHGMSKIFILSRRTGIPTMLDHSSDFILVLDKDLKIAEVNGNYLEFAGLDGRNSWENVQIPEAFRSSAARYSRIKCGMHRFGADIRAETREVLSGREFFFALRLTPTVFNDGSRGITIIITDITEIKKNEMMVRESEANFRILFGKSPVGTAVFDSAGKLMNGNPAFFATLGVQSPEGSPTMNLFTDMGIPPGSRDMLERGTMVKFAMPGFDSPAGKKHGHAARTDRADAIFEVNVTPVSQTSGEQKNGYLVQVTKNPVRSPGAVDTDHSLLAEILSCIEEAVILVDFPTGSISFVNRPAEKVFGFTAGEFLKKDPSRSGACGTISQIL